MITGILFFITLVESTSGFRFICYYKNSAQYRAGIGTFKPENIRPFLCTHIVYSYAAVTGLTIQQSEWNDNSTPWIKGMYDGVMEIRIKNPNLKILLAIGKDFESADSFLEAAKDSKSREVFARNVAIYITSRKFDGVQLEWANLLPTSNPEFSKHKFLLLVKTIKEVFKAESSLTDSRGLILAATLSAKKAHIDAGYEIKELANELDYISVRTIDMHTAADKRVGLSAPFLSNPDASGDEKYVSVKWVANYYVSLGVPKDKINIGIPTYGRSFTLGKEFQDWIGSYAVDDGNVGPWTAVVGVMGYFEMCDLIRLGGEVKDVPAQKGRYFVMGSQWISYEDVVSVIQKTCFIQTEEFGGITFWTLDLDDFTGESCLQGSFPLITTAVNMMMQPNTSLCYKLNPSVFVRVPTAPASGTTDETPSYVGETAEVSRVVCYFTNWARFRRGRAQYFPENINADICTHIVFLYAKVAGTKIAPFFRDDESEPWREGLFSRVVNTKKRKPQLNVLLCVGDPHGSSKEFIEVSKTAENREAFARNAALYLRHIGFDGLEVAWDQPDDDSRIQRAELVKTLRKTFEEEAAAKNMPRLLLSMVMPSGKKRIDEGYGDQLLEITRAVDFLSLWTYNFYGSWDVSTGLNSPLYANPDERDEFRHRNVDWVANYYLSKGVPKQLINIGIPTFAITFTLRDSKHNFLGSRVNGTGRPGKYTGKSGILALYEVCEFLSSGAEIVYVSSQLVSYAVKGDQWISFETTESVSEKACYAKSRGYGGVNMWSLDFDDFNGISCEHGIYPLVTTVYNIMQNVDEDDKCNSIVEDSRVTQDP